VQKRWLWLVSEEIQLTSNSRMKVLFGVKNENKKNKKPYPRHTKINATLGSTSDALLSGGFSGQCRKRWQSRQELGH